MRIYCLVSFWACVLGLLTRTVYVLADDYPRTTTHSAGEDLLHVVFGIAIFVWLGNILWGWL